MNLRELEYLVALADHRNFRLAAEVCGVSQPTLSAQIRKLEQELGVTLIERAPRNLLLTPAGTEAVARARRVLDEIAQMRLGAARHGENGRRRLHLGAFPTLGPYLLPHVVPRFVKAFPKVELLLTEEKSEILLNRLLEGRIDGALLALPVSDTHLTGRELFQEPFRLAVPQDHPLCHRSQIDAETLGSLKLMLLEEGHCLRNQALDICQLTGATEQGDFRGTSLETLRQMVLAGVGVTLMPQMACRSDVSASNQSLAFLPLQGAQFRRRIGLFWRKSSAQSQLLAETADLIRDTALDLLGETGC